MDFEQELIFGLSASGISDRRATTGIEGRELTQEEVTTSRSNELEAQGTQQSGSESFCHPIQDSAKGTEEAATTGNQGPGVQGNGEGCSQIRENLVDPLEDIRLSWVDEPKPDQFKNHRSLKRYANDLKLISSTMKNYSRSLTKVDEPLLKNTLEYGLKAHNVYAAALHQWLEDNPNSLARGVVEELITNYPEEDITKLKKYYARALKDPENRTVGTMSSSLRTSTSYLGTRISGKSLQIIEEQQKEIALLKRQKEMMELVIEEKEIDVQQIEKEKEMELKKRDLALKRKNVELETYKSFAEDASSIADAEDFNRVKDTYKGRLNFKLSTVPTGGPKMLNLIPDEDLVLSNMFETPGRDRFNQSNADNPASSKDYLAASEQACNAVGAKIPFSSDLSNAAVKVTEETTGVKDNLSQRASWSIQNQMKATQASTQRQSTSADNRAPRCSDAQSLGIPGVRDQHERRHVNQDERAIGNQTINNSNINSLYVPNCGSDIGGEDSSWMQQGTDNSAVRMMPAVTYNPWSYESLSWPTRLLDEAGGLRFDGTDSSEYPSFRHRLSTRFQELRKLRPDLLLQWIEATVEGQAKKYIRNAFCIMDPGKACDVVWQTLEEIYGQKEILVENAMKLVQRNAKSVGHSRKVFLEYRADLRSLQGVLNSLNKETALQKPQLLGSMYSALNDKLRSKLETNHSPDSWTFDMFIAFLTEEIASLDTSHVMKVDSSEDKKRHSPHIAPKPNFTKSRHFVPRVATSQSPQVNASKWDLHINQRCCLHPESASHSLTSCRNFLGMNTADRWRVARENNLCFNCLEANHRTRSCKDSGQCNKCQRFHHKLLHEEDYVQKQKSKGASTSSMQNKRLQSAKETIPDKVHSISMIERVTNQKGQVALMTLTALKPNSETLSFYAAIDTGATTSLCSRNLAERLLGEWKCYENREYKMFNGSIAKCQIMLGPLELKTTRGDVIHVDTISGGSRKFWWGGILSTKSQKFGCLHQN